MQIFLKIYFNFTLIYRIFQYIYIKKRLFLDINLTIDVSFTNYILLLQFTICFFYCSFAAFISPTNSGCGLFGLDFNSGWNCPAIKYGWFFSSTISTSLLSGDVPEQISPASSICFLYLLLYSNLCLCLSAISGLPYMFLALLPSFSMHG